MSLFQHFQVRRKLIVMLSVLFLTVALLLMQFTPALASIPIPGTYALDITYYSDASLTDPVGGWYYDCFGIINEWGERSSYQVKQMPRCNLDPLSK